MSGRVMHGEKRGRQLGFPTANIAIHRRQAPVAGVFAVELLGVEDAPIHGVANIGVRPTVDGSRCLLEVHLFDFNREIYGQHVRVCFRHKIRDEQRFESLDALKVQIASDCEAARAWLSCQSLEDPRPGHR